MLLEYQVTCKKELSDNKIIFQYIYINFNMMACIHTLMHSCIYTRIINNTTSKGIFVLLKS